MGVCCSCEKGRYEHDGDVSTTARIRRGATARGPRGPTDLGGAPARDEAASVDFAGASTESPGGEFRLLEGALKATTVERKLAAVLAADVAGYSRLMGADEDATMAAWWSHRAHVIDPSVAAHRGRIVKLTGDGFLAEFASVIDAVQAALAMQTEIKRRNEDVPADRRMEFRIGINLCDIMADAEDIYGDGVNIAARVEALAKPGGICVTGAVRDQTRGRHGLEYEDLGEQTVKNIAEPVHVYRLRVADGAQAPPSEPTPAPASARRPVRRWAAAVGALVLAVAVAGGTLWLRPWERGFEAASEERMAFPLPDKPSVAVLPFDNLSGDPDQEHFADGLTENIISTLSRVPTMFVISRNSTFTYKGRPVKVQEVAENLGVRYVLEGSIRVADDRVRVTAQLIDALAGTHMWSEQYDREYGDLFALHDDITRKIVTALQVELTDGEQARVWSAHTDNPEAGNLLMKGLEKFYRFNKEDNLLARAELERAVDADPYFGLGYTVLAWTHWADAHNAWTESPERSLTRAVLFAGKAMALDPDIPDVYALRGAIHLYRREFADAIAEGEKALELNPNHATNAALLAMTLLNAGRAADALAMIRTAMRLSPYYPDWFVGILADSHYDLGQYEQSAAVLLGFEERPERADAACHCRVGIALAYAALGREDEALEQIALLRAEDPQFTISRIRTSALHKDTSLVERRAAVLKRLGLPE